MVELTRQTLRVEWRAIAGWAVSTLALVVVLVAFFPAVKGNSALTDSFTSLPPSVQSAFGIANLSSAPGYPQGQMFSTLAPPTLRRRRLRWPRWGSCMARSRWP